MDLAADSVTLRRSDFYLWRLFATGMSFMLFGVGGVLLYLLVFPVLWMLPGCRLARRRRMRAAISRAFDLHVQFMYRSGVLTYEVIGAERLGRPGQMIIANHPSLIDVVLLVSQIRDANCVVKQSLWRNPCMRGPITRAEYIPNNGDPEMLEHAADVLREGQTLIVFPEGTRTTPGQAPEFHRGAAAIALRGASVITPVFISMVPSTLTKAEPWYSIPHRRMHMCLRVGADIDPAAFNADAPMPIASRRLNRHLHTLYLKELLPP
jgi:1-acyl-sn-glycerol-3-phosphate acyltransferase